MAAQVQVDRRCVRGPRSRQVRNHETAVASDAREFRRVDAVDEHQSGCRFLETKTLVVRSLQTGVRARRLEG